MTDRTAIAGNMASMPTSEQLKARIASRAAIEASRETESGDGCLQKP
jgi:hypothetical protein